MIVWKSLIKNKIDCDTAFKIQKQILTDEIDDPEFLEFAIENFSEMMGYIAQGNLNIRIHRDITGEMWFGVRYNLTPNFKGGTNNRGRSKVYDTLKLIELFIAIVHT